MWKIFKESVWDFVLGKVASVLGLIGTIQTVISLINPNYVITVTNVVKIDYRFWFVFTLLLFVGIILRVLKVASNYKQRYEGTDNIRIVYNEQRYSVCREDRGHVEIIRVGFRVLGNKPISNPVVLPSNLFRIESQTNYIRIPIMTTPLSAMVRQDIVHSGRTPEYWVDVFRHKTGANEIELCYDNISVQMIPLTLGSYKLELIARGDSSNSSFGTLNIAIDGSNRLSIEIEGKSIWNT